jgi:hypothetical protein
MGLIGGYGFHYYKLAKKIPHNPSVIALE